MTMSEERIRDITLRLKQAFSPSYLEVIDESDEHIGHAGYQDGARHFAITIKADCLARLTRVAAHQQIYAELADLIPEKIHALRIRLL